jgi:NAD(P)-dependent dehydrogenase (short-subunit alcohol dehydrogenase family)
MIYFLSGEQKTMNLEGKTVLITGGTGALGRVVAKRFIDQGCKIAASYLFEDELKRLDPEFKAQVQLVHADVTNEEDVAALYHQIHKQCGEVRILIHLVGGFLPSAKLKDVSVKDWEGMLGINLRSMFLCSRQFLRQLSDDSYGRIISIAAMPALKPAAGRAPYAVAKGGIVTLTQVLGEECKGTGVTANAIAPSILRTQANTQSMPGEDASKWVAPEEIAELISLLCSDNGRSINGVCIPVFGGV